MIRIRTTKFALAAAALSDFPEERVVARAAVGELHERARRALERVDVELQTSTSRGFQGEQVLPRTLTVIDGEADPGLKGKP